MMEAYDCVVTPAHSQEMYFRVIVNEEDPWMFWHPKLLLNLLRYVKENHTIDVLLLHLFLSG